MDSSRFRSPWCLARGDRRALRHSISASLLIYHPSNTHCCWEKHGSAGNAPGTAGSCAKETLSLFFSRLLVKVTHEMRLGWFLFPFPLFCLLRLPVSRYPCAACLLPRVFPCPWCVQASKSCWGGWSCPEVLQVRVSTALGWKGP